MNDTVNKRIETYHLIHEFRGSPLSGSAPTNLITQLLTAVHWTF